QDREHYWEPTVRGSKQDRADGLGAILFVIAQVRASPTAGWQLGIVVLAERLDHPALTTAAVAHHLQVRGLAGGSELTEAERGCTRRSIAVHEPGPREV